MCQHASLLAVAHVDRQLLAHNATRVTALQRVRPKCVRTCQYGQERALPYLRQSTQPVHTVGQDACNARTTCVAMRTTPSTLACTPQSIITGASAALLRVTIRPVCVRTCLSQVHVIVQQARTNGSVRRRDNDCVEIAPTHCKRTRAARTVCEREYTARVNDAAYDTQHTQHTLTRAHAQTPSRTAPHTSRRRSHSHSHSTCQR
jgi:hypothetical protein